MSLQRRRTLSALAIALVPVLAPRGGLAQERDGAPALPQPTASPEGGLEAGADLASHLHAAGGLHAADVVQAVLHTSYDREARLADVQAARAEIDRANFNFVPRLAITASYMRLSPIDSPVLGVLAAPANQQTGVIADSTPLVGVALQFPVILDQTQFSAQLAIPVTDYFLRVMPARDAAEHGTEAAEAMVVATERRLALEAETLYWTWARAELGIVVAQHALEQARAHRVDAERLQRAGLATQLDVVRADAQVAAVQELVENTGHARDAARDRLRTIMHVSSIPEGIGDALDEGGATGGDLESDVTHALESRSELHALDEQIASLEAQRSMQSAGYFPRVDVVGQALLANPNPRFIPQSARFDFTWSVGAQATFQLADALATAPTESALDARLAGLRAQRETLREGVRAEVVDARRALADARVSLGSRRAQLEAAQRALQLASDVYRNGRGTSLQVIDAQTLVLRSDLELLGARIDERVARARVARALEQ